jgi:hypothetical protein
MIRCKNCLKELSANTEACGNCGALVHPSPVVYFRVPMVYLTALCLLTLGIYQIYWFYKNWAAVKKAKGIRGIYPFWRALFAALFCWSLFKRIRNKAAFLFIGSHVGLLILDELMRITPLPSPTFLLLVFLSLQIIALLIAQRAIEFHNKHAIAD